MNVQSGAFKSICLPSPTSSNIKYQILQKQLDSKNADGPTVQFGTVSFLLDVTHTKRVAQKWHSFWYALTSSNINRFSKLFHCQNREKMCNKNVTKDPTAPQVCRYTTLWNVKCLQSNNWKQDDFCNSTFLKKLTTGNNVFIVSAIV